MAERKRKHKPYDYQLLIARPKAFGFFVGWYGQYLFTAVHMLQARPPGKDTRKRWNMGQNEVCRLAAMLRAWCDEHDVQVSSDLVHSLTTLHRDLGPEGYRTSVQALGGPGDLGDHRFRKTGDGRYDLGDDYFPNILAEDHGIPGDFGQLCTRLKHVVLQMGRAVGQARAVELGAGISGVAHALATANIKGTVYSRIQSLVDFGLLESGTDIETDVTPYTGMDMGKALDQASAAFLGTRGSDWTQLRDRLATLPAAICKERNIPLPPVISDVDAFPDINGLVSTPDESLRTACEPEPPVVAPAETKKTATKSKPRSKKPAASEEFRLTLYEFASEYCELTKMGPSLLKSRVQSLQSAVRRGVVELPPCQENWRSGQSKKFRMSDLKQCWPGLRETWPGLPSLKN